MSQYTKYQELEENQIVYQVLESPKFSVKDSFFFDGQKQSPKEQDEIQNNSAKLKKDDNFSPEI